MAEGEERVAVNQDQFLHVSEEAAALAKILHKAGCGKAGPELEQGTPVEDVSLPYRFISFLCSFVFTSCFPRLRIYSCFFLSPSSAGGL